MNINFNTILSTLMAESINLLKNNSSQRRKKINRLSALKEAYEKFEKFETDFEKDFIEAELKETCFYIISGIETNYISLPMYLELKRKLGLNYSWVHIKRAQQHFDLKGDIIKINLNKFEKHYSNVTLISFPIILLMAIILFAYLNQKYKLNGILDYIIIVSSLIIPLILAYLFVASADSILTARKIEKRLNNL